ncbi:MAG: DUF1307 domain-containing protein [Bacilli bacterium]|nr:DUF1307 domain-containing protein [Bacilli bacterium]
MRKICLIITLFFILFLLCGCDSKNREVIIDGESINTSKMEHKHCTRNGSLQGGEAKLEYDIYYTGDVLNLLKSREEIISADENILDTYEEAYKSIHANYRRLANYDTEIIRGDTTVTSIMNINYDSIDIDKLIEIEGEEDNIFVNKVPSVSKWLAFAKKLGTTCELVK